MAFRKGVEREGRRDKRGYIPNPIVEEHGLQRSCARRKERATRRRGELKRCAQRDVLSAHLASWPA